MARLVLLEVDEDVIFVVVIVIRMYFLFPPEVYMYLFFQCCGCRIDFITAKKNDVDFVVIKTSN
jgi:hypothetical protein